MTSETAPRRPTIWFETGDFLGYFEYTARPTGIQRTQWEIFRRVATETWPEGEMRFCRLDETDQCFYAVDAATVIDTFRHPPLRWTWQPDAPGETRWQRFWRDQRIKRGNQWRRYRWKKRHRALPAPAAASFAPGDVLVCLGMGFSNPDYAAAFAREKRRKGLHFAFIVYDIIPIVYPHWTNCAEPFGRWFAGMFAIADHILTISEATRAALATHAAARGLPLPRTTVLRLGASFHAEAPQGSPDDQAIAALPRPFVLFVSTLEIRKNHLLMLRVWERLVARHGAASVPSLVLVGRHGWLIDALLERLAATRHLDGKIVVFRNLSDPALRQAYCDCLFTVYPSFAEGWGLPIAESLEAGKLCIASDRTSMPEVGGPLVDYIDPEDEDGALAAVERALFDTAYRIRREAEIRACYVAPEWSDLFRSVLASLAELATRTSGESEAAQ